METLMPVQAVILDLDGLMVDSEPLAKQAWRTLLARYGHTLDQEIIIAMLGLRLADSSLLVKERFGLPLSAPQIAAEEKRIFMGLLDGNLRPMPGLSDLLGAIDARGLPRAVATSSGRDGALIALRAVGVADGFSAIVTGDDVVHGKPAPDIYLAAAAELGRQPASCLALEDSPHGVSAAKAAGMHCVAVPNELTAEMDLRMADWVLPSLMAVTDQLDNLLLPSPAVQCPAR
jgi:HAD superfamily hydrolase (TIGR01509 family)